MFKQFISTSLMFGVLFAQDLPKLEEVPNLPILEQPKVNMEAKEEKIKLTKGLAYLDICTQSDYISSNDFKKDLECREYYSKANEQYLFNINEFDLSKFLLNQYGNKLKFNTKIIIPQELIRDDKVYLLADSFNRNSQIQYEYKKGYFENATIKFRYFVNGEEVKGNNYLVELKGKDTIDLDMEMIFAIQYDAGVKKFNDLLQEDKEKTLNIINKFLNHNLQIQEKKEVKKRLLY